MRLEHADRPTQHVAAAIPALPAAACGPVRVGRLGVRCDHALGRPDNQGWRNRSVIHGHGQTSRGEQVRAPIPDQVPGPLSEVPQVADRRDLSANLPWLAIASQGLAMGD